MTSGIHTRTHQVIKLNDLYHSGCLPKRRCAKIMSKSPDWAKKWLKKENYTLLTGRELYP